MRFLVLLSLVCSVIPAFGEKAADSSAAPPDSISAGTRIVEYIAYPTLQVLTWPVDHIMVPVVRVLIYPSQEPIRYFLNESVVDRMIGLISYGNGEKIMTYPTLNLSSGTSSRTGLTFRNRALFGRSSERLVAYGLLYVNGDFKLRSYVTADEVFGTSLGAKTGVGVVRMKNASANQPGTNEFLYYSDSSEIYQFQLRHPLFLGFHARGAFFLRRNRLGRAPPSLLGADSLVSGFFRNPGTGLMDSAYRGLGQSFWERIWQIGLTRDTRNNENIPLAGSTLDLGWSYHDAGLRHSYHDWGMVYSKYMKLGRERYEITSEEERRRGGMNLTKFLHRLEYEKLKRDMVSRKVVALHLYVGQIFELPGNSLPVYGLQTLGNDTPLRGYSGSRFRDYTVAGVSAEYRFPVLRIMDGTLFDEYGVHGRSWQAIDYLSYKNSWGFGIRVRRPDIFLFRMDLGIHGISGVLFNMSVDAPF